MRTTKVIRSNCEEHHELIPNSKYKCQPNTEFENCSNDFEVVEEFNQTFWSIGSSLAKFIDKVDKSQLPDLVASGNIFWVWDG